MTNEELDAMKYKICCPICDNYKCLRGTEKCEAELWKKWRMRQMTNELSVKDAIEVFEFMKREVLEGSKEDKVLDIAIKALKQQSFEGKTNGDVIKAMFPNIRIIDMPDVEVVQVVNEENDIFWGESRNFHYTWWNSSYKECDEE